MAVIPMLVDASAILRLPSSDEVDGESDEVDGEVGGDRRVLGQCPC